MSFRYNSTAGWNSPPVLPLGMRLTEVKSRTNSNDSFADFQNENESEVDFLNLSDSFSRFSSEQVPSCRHDSENDEIPTERKLLTENSIKSSNPRVARIEEFAKKYRINLVKNMKAKTSMHNCKLTSQNSKTLSKYRNKVLHYYNLLRKPKVEDVEHPDIVKFRRVYGLRRPISPSALHHKADSTFQPNFLLSPGFDDQNNSIDSRTQLPVTEEYKSRYFTPLASVENYSHSDTSRWVRNCEQKRPRFDRDSRTIDDLIKYNSSLIDDSTCQLRRSPKDDQLLPDSPKMSYLVADDATDAEVSSHFPDFPPVYDQHSVFLSEDYSAGRSEASLTSTGVQSTIDGSSFAPTKRSITIDLQHASHPSSPLEQNRLSRFPPSVYDTIPNIGSNSQTLMSSSPPIEVLPRSSCEFSPKWLKNVMGGKVVSDPDAGSSIDRGDVANSTSTISPFISDSQDIFNQCSSPRLPENGVQNSSPAADTRNQCEVNDVKTSLENETPYLKCSEHTSSPFKYYQVPGKPTDSENEVSASGEKTNCANMEAPFYSDLPARNGEIVVEYEENAITDKYSPAKDEEYDSVDSINSPNGNPTTAAFSSAPDSFMEEISFSPDEDEDSVADVSQNAVLRVRFVEGSPFKIFSDSSCSSSPVSDG